MARPVGNASAVLHLLRDGPQTAQALAARLDLDVSSVRRHLDTLGERAWIMHQDRAEGPGRPKRHYALTGPGWESFPRDYAFLLGALLDRLQQRVGRGALLASFADVAAALAAEVRPDQPRAARLEALRQLYLDLGFEASLETREGQDCIVQRNCPFLKTAKQDPEALCECLDEGIIRQVFPDAAVTLGDCMATGDNLCRHFITQPPTG